MFYLPVSYHIIAVKTNRNVLYEYGEERRKEARCQKRGNGKLQQDSETGRIPKVDGCGASGSFDDGGHAL